MEWQRKPNVIMVRAGVRIVPNTTLATRPLIRAMIRFCAVTNTEHAQQSREPLNSSGGSAASLPPAEYGGGTTTPDPVLEGLPLSERACSDTVFSSVPFRDRLIFMMRSAAGQKITTIKILLNALYGTRIPTYSCLQLRPSILFLAQVIKNTGA